MHEIITEVYKKTYDDKPTWKFIAIFMVAFIIISAIIVYTTQ